MVNVELNGKQIENIIIGNINDYLNDIERYIFTSVKECSVTRKRIIDKVKNSNINNRS